MKPEEIVMDALRQGEQDAQLLDGRDFNAGYWRNARRQLNMLRRRLEIAERECDAFAAVVSNAREES